MGVGVCALMVAGGAGLCMAMDPSVSGMLVQTIGLGVMIAGVLGLVLSFAGTGTRIGRSR